MDGQRTAILDFDGIDVEDNALCGPEGGALEALEWAIDRGAAAACAEGQGQLQEMFERTVEYLKQRKQFGVLIGSFQALQHRAAQLFGEIELCKSLVLKALQALDNGDPDLAELASLTKAKLSEATHQATTEAIQMHGGIGMTDDFEIGFFLKRYRVLETLYGDRYFHLDRFARQRGY